jgi:signal peptidase I
MVILMSKKNNIKKETDESIEVEKDIIVKEKNDNKIVKFIKELIPYVIILIVVVLVRTYLFTPIIVSGPSMKPTLDGGELMILNKLNKEYERFDVVVVDIGSEDIIKRIIAMPGESISCENGIVYVNGRKQEESYSKGITFSFDKVVLGEDEYFVMGDNREDSKDSRHLGPIKVDNIKGTTTLVLFPFGKIGNIE